MAAQNDLTQGGIVRQLIRYSIPLVISSILQAMYGMVDMIVAGHFIGSDGLSAITNASTVMNMLTQILIGLSTGGNILIAQYYGAKDSENAHAATCTLITGGFILGIVLSAALPFAAAPALRLLGAPSLAEATVYLQTCILGIFFITGYNTASAALRAVGNSSAPLICVTVTTVLNAVLDIIFVGPLGMGVFGAAAATVISQGVSFLVAMGFVLRHPDIFGLRLRALRIRLDKLRLILKLGIPCAVQMSVASLSWLSVTYIVNSYGVVISAANGVSGKIKDFCQLFTIAMSNGAAGMIAQNIGAGQYDRARTVLYTAMRITIGMAILIILIVELLAPQLCALFTYDAETVAAAALNLRIEILGQIFYACFLVYHALALGVGNTWYVLISSSINCIFARIIFGFVFNHFFGILGLYWACMIAPATSVPLGIWYERSNRWRRRLT